MALSSDNETYYAPAGRDDHDSIQHQIEHCIQHPITHTIMEIVNGYALILNRKRQILAGNQTVLDALGTDNASGVVGLRPGEAFNCVHFEEGPDGCGTSPHCNFCGAVIAIISSMEKDKSVTDECALKMYHDGKTQTVEFKIRATPLKIGDTDLTVIVLQDISDTKRRHVLEQVFFHDILNTIGGIEGWTSFLKQLSNEDSGRELIALAEQLKDEVYAQRTLMEAESGTLDLEIQPIQVSDVFKDMGIMFQVHPIASGKQLKQMMPQQPVVFDCDRTLLNRVLINMIKNAFEATPADGTVTFGFRMEEEHPLFWVHNDTVIPQAIQDRVFERSFSTHGTGRGIGTWSMQLMGEFYLGGSITFTSDPETGTTFELRLPDHAHDTHRKTPPRVRHDSERSISTVGDTGQARRILVVDDNEPLLRLTELFVRQAGHIPLAFGEPVSVLAELAENPGPIDAALIDVGLPVMSGIELAHRLKVQMPHLPVALMTGYAEDLTRETAQKLGVAHLAKPFSQQMLTSMVEQLLSSVNTDEPSE